MDRGYKKNFVTSQRDKARGTSRTAALRDRNRERNDRLPFVVTYHLGLPSIGQILRDLHSILQSSDRCSGAIANVPMVAFRRPKSLAEYLVRSKMKEGEKEDVKRGTNKCASKRCEVCNYLDERNYFKGTGTDKKYFINYSINCNSSNVIYLITCKI